MRFVSKIGVALAAFGFSIPATAQAPDHINMMPVVMSDIVEQPNVVIITNESGESLKVALTNCSPRWDGGDVWIMMRVENNFFLVRYEDFRVVYTELNDWNQTVETLVSHQRICVPVIKN